MKKLPIFFLTALIGAGSLVSSAHAQAKDPGMALLTTEDRGRFVLLVGPPNPTCASDPEECKGLGGLSPNLKNMQAHETDKQIAGHKFKDGWLMPEVVLPLYLKLFKKVDRLK